MAGDDPLEGERPESEPEPEGEAEGEGGKGALQETIKKALLAGMGALFMTEEGARRLAREWKLPRDIGNFIGQQAHGAKDEMLRVFSEEIRRFLESEPLRREFLRSLSSHVIEVKAEIRVREDERGEPKAEVSADVKGHRPAKG